MYAAADEPRAIQPSGTVVPSYVGASLSETSQAIPWQSGHRSAIFGELPSKPVHRPEGVTMGVAPSRNSLSAISATLLAVVLLAGCGSTSTTATSTDAHSTQSSVATRGTSTSAKGQSTSSRPPSSSSTPKQRVPDISIPVSVATRPRASLRRYTCAGQDISLPLRWGKVPRKTAEVEVFIFQTLPVEGKLVPIWSLSAVRPNIHHISAGVVPHGAIVGADAAGAARYSLCPQKGQQISYTAMVVPVPERIPTKPSFDAEALVKRALKLSGVAGRVGFVYERA